MNMKRNKFEQFSPETCEPHLSTFGKQVLQALVQQWNKEQEQRVSRKDNQNRRLCRNKKLLNFNDESLSNIQTVTALHPSPIQIHTTTALINFDPANDVAPISPVKETSKTFSTHEITNHNDFLHPAIINRKIINEIFDREVNNIGQEQHLKEDKYITDNIDHKTNDVDWDNMFDSDLFSDVVSENNDDTFNNNINKDNEHNKGAKRKNKTVKDKSFKKIKLNNDGSKNSPKANKLNNEVPKVNHRKEKYTKTVKNWLNAVESYNDVNGMSNIEDICNTNNSKNVVEIDKNKHDNNCKTREHTNMPKINVDKTKEPKKKVQAQLVNKDGIMKYSRSKIDIDHTKLEGNNNKVLKDKKDKTVKQFIPPIKSQIPVKDIIYDILTIDEKNADEFYIKNVNETNDVIAILIYSNGFCQLNSHFTDGTCAADGIIFGTGEGNTFYCFKGSGPNVRKALTRMLLENIIISYESRHILIYMASHLQMDIRNINVYDLKIGASLLDPDNPPENFSALQKLLSFVPHYTVATECILQKAAWYITILNECWLTLKDKLVKDQLWQIFVEVEMKLLPIISEMERRGILIDLVQLKSMEETLLTRMKLVEQECYKVAGRVFQINSTLQVRKILYDELQLDTKFNIKIRETMSGGVKSTSETMLRSLMTIHPLPKLILEYRHLHKAYATFLSGIAQQVKDGIVQPNWVQTAAATGRIASNNPNLQAIPKVTFSVVMFPDEDNIDIPQLNFRSVYVSREGFTFLSADFKHVECRVLAHVAADTGLLRTLTSSDDLFRVLAAQWLNKAESSVSPADRERTKRLVYASLYGASTRKLMEILDVSNEQAKKIAISFDRTFPSLKSFGRHVVGRCSMAGGKLTTLRGRLRHFTNITSEDFNLRSHAERQAVNFIIQGSAADLCKTAMILTEEQLRNTSPPVEANLLLQIHDELVWEVRDKHVNTVAGIIKRVMEGCGQYCGMSVPLPVAISVGNNWGDMLVNLNQPLPKWTIADLYEAVKYPEIKLISANILI